MQFRNLVNLGPILVYIEEYVTDCGKGGGTYIALRVIVSRILQGLLRKDLENGLHTTIIINVFCPVSTR